MANILIIDDDKMICDALCDVLRERGYESTNAITLKDGFEKASTGAFDVVFLDVRMPDGNGLDVLPRIMLTPSSPEVIIITGQGEPDGAELAIRSGAWDYIQKPFSAESMIQHLARALRYREEKKLAKPLGAFMRGNIIGESPQLTDCLKLAAQAAQSDANVLITGETGTGKELFARAVHSNSQRSKKNFVVVDCAALPKTLVESVLFGHEKGAFTGADTPHIGLLKQADGGTLFLDEVGELPLFLQKAFLRVLQERRLRPIGGKGEIESDFRLVVATNRDLDKMVQNRQFRNELLFRIRSFTIHLPPLRERREDIKQLATFHTVKLCKRYGMKPKSFSPEFLDILLVYDWPGNVRELANTIDKAIAIAQDAPILFCKHLPTRLRVRVARVSVTNGPAAGDDPARTAEPFRVFPKFRNFQQATEQEYLQDLISLTRGNIKAACRICGMSRSHLYALLNKHKLSTRG
ncbi:MAG: sigma-54-dependent Fis family transcriptional regulator [Deltaproteobacteria bacterium]|nr:sigma-54-dependent Fis family transcriptional regulator [Deltaproteobacteria bacterium]